MNWQCFVLICQLVTPLDGSGPYIDNEKRDCTPQGPFSVTAPDYTGSLRGLSHIMQSLENIWVMFESPPARFRGDCSPMGNGAPVEPPREYPDHPANYRN